MRRMDLQSDRSSYKIFLYIFYVCACVMSAITTYGIYSMGHEWINNGTYVMGETLVETEFPHDNFAKLTTWLFFTTIIGWYCVTRIGFNKTTQIKSWQLTLVQLMVLSFAIICLYEVLYNFTVLNAKIAASLVESSGVEPDIDSLTIAYPDPSRPWNLIFATKMFLAGFLISAHAFYLSTRSNKKKGEEESVSSV